jgi:hypothetical protein
MDFKKLLELADKATGGAESVKTVAQALGLLNSMIESGEEHTSESRRILLLALDELIIIRTFPATIKALVQRVQELEKQESKGMECTLGQMLSKEQQERYGLDEHEHRRNVQHIWMRACDAISELEQDLTASRQSEARLRAGLEKINKLNTPDIQPRTDQRQIRKLRSKLCQIFKIVNELAHPSQKGAEE